MRVKLVERLGWTFEQVNDTAYTDICDLLEVWRADEVESQRQRTRQQAVARLGRRGRRGY